MSVCTSCGMYDGTKCPFHASTDRIAQLEAELAELREILTDEADAIPTWDEKIGRLSLSQCLRILVGDAKADADMLASERARHARTQAEAAVMMEVVACANYLLVSFSNPHHAPIAKKRLESAFLALWKLLGVSEDDPFLPHPYDAAMDALRRKSAGRVLSERVPWLEVVAKAMKRIVDTDTHGINVPDESGAMRPTGTDFCGRCNRNSFWPHADDCPIKLGADALAALNEKGGGQ